MKRQNDQRPVNKAIPIYAQNVINAAKKFVSAYQDINGTLEEMMTNLETTPFRNKPSSTPCKTCGGTGRMTDIDEGNNIEVEPCPDCGKEGGE